MGWDAGDGDTVRGRVVGCSEGEPYACVGSWAAATVRDTWTSIRLPISCSMINGVEGALGRPNGPQAKIRRLRTITEHMSGTNKHRGARITRRAWIPDAIRIKMYFCVHKIKEALTLKT